MAAAPRFIVPSTANASTANADDYITPTSPSTGQPSTSWASANWATQTPIRCLIFHYMQRPPMIGRRRIPTALARPANTRGAPTGAPGLSPGTTTPALGLGPPTPIHHHWLARGTALLDNRILGQPSTNANANTQMESRTPSQVTLTLVQQRYLSVPELLDEHV